MADKIEYPGESDLCSLFESTGVVDTTECNFVSVDLRSKLDAAVDEWQEATGWFPFLGDAQDSTRVFDPPGPDPGRNGLSLRGGGKKLFLKAGLLSLTSLTISGVPFQQGVNFWLRPDNAPVKSRPFTRIDFAAPVFGAPQSVAVTGKWGFWPTLRNSAFQAVLQKAAALCVPEIGLMISQGLYKVQDVQYSNTGGMTPLFAERGQWEKYFDAIAEDLGRDTIDSGEWMYPLWIDCGWRRL